jgi:TRAP-type mannitol/chloroaromatic compound transport system substrate-binding protein
VERRKFIADSAVALGAAAAAVACTSQKSSQSSAGSRQKFNWRLVMAIPKTLPIWGTGVESFAEKVKVMSDGDLSVQVYGAGELVPALGTFDAVQAGQVEMGHAAAYYWQGKIPAASFFTAVPFGLNVAGMNSWLKAGGQDLWDELYAPYGIMGLPAGNTGLQMGGWYNREIKSAADFKGLKMRIPGLGSKVIARLGAEPVLVAGGEIYTNLATGVIDATEWVGPYHDYVLGLHKVAKYYYYPGWHEPAPVLELMINKAAWEKLPKDLQQIVRSAASELDRDMYAGWLAQDMVHLEKIRTETKVEVREFPENVLKALKAAAAEVKEEVAATSELARKIYDSYSKHQTAFDAFQDVTERAYYRAQSV